MCVVAPVIVYDGYCNLCGAIVRFVKKRDTHGRFEYVPLQSERGSELSVGAGLTAGDVSTVVLAYNSGYYIRSEAVLLILKLLGGRWRLMYGFIVIPGFIRDAVYSLIARTRYRLFGRSNNCYIP